MISIDLKQYTDRIEAYERTLDNLLDRLEGSRAEYRAKLLASLADVAQAMESDIADIRDREAQYLARTQLEERMQGEDLIIANIFAEVRVAKDDYLRAKKLVTDGLMAGISFTQLQDKPLVCTPPILDPLPGMSTEAIEEKPKQEVKDESESKPPKAKAKTPNPAK